MFNRCDFKSKRIWLFLLLAMYFLIAYIAMNYYNITCVFIEIFGIPCPGCGMTRAFLALLRLDLYCAAKYNVVIFFMPYVFMYVFFDFKHKIHNAVLIGIAVISVINWAIKIVEFF